MNEPRPITPLTGGHPWRDKPIEPLPVERCACGLESRGLVDGVCADCRALTTASHEALNERVRAAARPAVNQLTLVTVARTLRTIAFQGMGGKGLIELAEDVERQDADSLYMCCPVCQETTCDDGCPLAEVRAG